MIELLFVALLTGIVVKVTDTIIDENLDAVKIISYTFAILYGLLISFVIVQYPSVAPLWIGIIVGVLLGKKVDALPHALGILTVFVATIWSGIPALNYYLIFVFALSSYVDERIDKYLHGRKTISFFGKMLSMRIITEITALIVSALTGTWIIILALICFDAGYLAVTHFFEQPIRRMARDYEKNRRVH